MKRPQIKIGDVVKLSKFGKQFAGDIPLNATMIVTKIAGDGIDRTSCIVVRLGKYEFEFRRNELWKTGFNINDTELELSIDAPINNNGRYDCYVCGLPTKTISLFISDQQICNNLNCRWFEN